MRSNYFYERFAFAYLLCKIFCAIDTDGARIFVCFCFLLYFFVATIRFFTYRRFYRDLIPILISLYSGRGRSYTIVNLSLGGPSMSPYRL